MQPSSHNDTSQLLADAISAFQAGNRDQAQRYLTQAIYQNPHNDELWVWMSAVVSDPAQRRDCLERALAINPANDAARRGLEYLQHAVPDMPVVAPEQPRIPANISADNETTDATPAISEAQPVVATSPASHTIPSTKKQQGNDELKSLRKENPPRRPWFLIGLTGIVTIAVITMSALVLAQINQRTSNQLASTTPQSTTSVQAIAAATSQTEAPTTAVTSEPTAAPTAVPTTEPTAAPSATPLPDVNAQVQAVLRIQRSGDKDLAMTMYNDIVAAHPDNAMALYYRGDMRISRGDLQGGEADHQAAQKLDPDPAQIAYHHARSISDTQPEEALASYDEAIRLAPDFDDAYYARGSIRQLQRDYQGAFDDYSRSIELAPTTSFAYTNRGLIFANRGDYQAAISDYSQAIAIGNGLLLTYTVRAEAYLAINEQQKALDDYSQAIALSPGDIKLYSQRSMVYSMLGNRNAAMHDAIMIKTVQPKTSREFTSRGEFRQLSGDKKGAIADYTEAIKRDAFNDDAYCSRGTVYASLGRYEDAEADCTKALEINASHTDAYYNRGIDRFHLEKYPAAIEDFTNLLKLEPEEANAFYYRAECYRRTGDKKHALSDYKAALALYDKQGTSSKLYDYIKQRITELST